MLLSKKLDITSLPRSKKEKSKKKPIKHCKQQIFEEIETEKCKCIDVRVSTHKYAALNGYSVVRQFWLATK